MSKICIIGTEGSGKTVFISVLAKKYADEIVFTDAKTQRYVTTVWTELLRQQWPETTDGASAEELKEIQESELLLNWKLTVKKKVHELSIMDTPGQDIRRAFSDGIQDKKLELLKKHICGADILLLLLNLNEAIRIVQSADSPSEKARKIADIEAPVVLIINDALRRGAILSLVLSQYDQVEPYLKNEGIKDTLEAIHKLLPAVHGAITQAGGPQKIKFFPIAAVAVTEEKGGRLVPKITGEGRDAITSSGLEKILEWIKMKVGFLAFVSKMCARIRNFFGKEQKTLLYTVLSSFVAFLLCVFLSAAFDVNLFRWIIPIVLLTLILWFFTWKFKKRAAWLPLFFAGTCLFFFWPYHDNERKKEEIERPKKKREIAKNFEKERSEIVIKHGEDVARMKKSTKVVEKDQLQKIPENDYKVVVDRSTFGKDKIVFINESGYSFSNPVVELYVGNSTIKRAIQNLHFVSGSRKELEGYNFKGETVTWSVFHVVPMPVVVPLTIEDKRQEEEKIRKETDEKITVLTEQKESSLKSLEKSWYKIPLRLLPIFSSVFLLLNLIYALLAIVILKLLPLPKNDTV